MFSLVRASFNQRRKTLVNGLSNSPEITFSKDDILRAVEQLGLGMTVRGEALTLEQFARLSDLFTEIGQEKQKNVQQTGDTAAPGSCPAE